MGAINHVLCHSFPAESLHLAINLLQAHATFGLVNVGIKNVALSALSGTQGENEQILIGIGSAIYLMRASRDDIFYLQKKMENPFFHDLPALKQIDFVKLGDKLVEAKMVDLDTWKFVTIHSVDGGSIKVISYLESEICKIIRLLVFLQNQLLEEDSITSRNVQVTLSKIYTIWNHFDRLFHAATLCSMEQWNVHKGYQSLVDMPCLKKVVVI